jgi:rhodanese-related sulfurtransferase
VLDATNLKPLTATQLIEEQRNGALVLDIRDPEKFASFHLRGTMQIGLSGPFASWAAMLIQPPSKLLLIAEDVSSVHEAIARLARVGIENVIGYSLADKTEWQTKGLDIASIPIKRCAAVQRALRSDPSIQLIDVRSHAEWSKGHLPCALSLSLLDLDSSMKSVDRSKPSLVYCHEGFRATTAASILLRENTSEVDIFIDGVEGWIAAGLPLEIPDTST